MFMVNRKLSSMTHLSFIAHFGDEGHSEFTNKKFPIPKAKVILIAMLRCIHSTRSSEACVTICSMGIIPVRAKEKMDKRGLVMFWVLAIPQRSCGPMLTLS